MGLKKFEKDMNIIAALDDEPNDVGGLSAAQLKERFDQAGREIKEYINEDMIPALEAETAAASLGVRMPSSSGREGPGTIQEAIDSLSAVAMGGGAVPSGGLPGQILAKADAEDHHLKWISADAEAFGSYRKEKILSAATKTLFGLGADAVPDDVLAFLGKYNQHWWRRRTPSYYEAVVGEYGNKPLSWREANGTTTEIQYSDSITFDAAGVISLVDPVTIGVSYTNYTAANVIKGKYFRYKLLTGEGTTTPESGSDYSGVHLAANADATQDVDTTTSDNVNFYIVYMSAAPVTSLFTDSGQWEYLRSSERNAYPDSGTSDGYEYEYLGIPFENAVTAPKIAAGSYVGTGTYGQSNPNTLEFDAPPLMVFVVGEGSFFAIQGSSEANVIYYGSGGALNLTWNGNSLSWYVYAEPTDYKQFNMEGKTYYYIALWI